MASDRPWHEVMRELIDQNMVGNTLDDDDSSFITFETLQGLWRTNIVQYRAMQAAVGVRFSDSTIPFNNVILVTSILTTMALRDWSTVGQLLLTGFVDVNLPYKLNDLISVWFPSFFSDRQYARDFASRQFAFCPIVIYEGQDIPHRERKMRLPFLSEEPINAGFYGTVTKIKIAKGYLYHKNQYGEYEYSTKDIIVARKRFHQAAQGHVEQRVLNRLRNQRLKIDCIMYSFASVNLGFSLGSECEYNLFFPYAPTDLYNFLFEKLPSHQVLDIKQECITPLTLFKEFLALVDGLRFLHRKDLRMCHSDLKPNNILIVRSADHPIGQWMITDFGIASIESKPPSEARGLGDLFSASTSASHRSRNVASNDQRVEGEFQPPEVEYPGIVPENVPYRAKGDIWSLGCIAIYVLVYAIGGVSCVEELENILHSRNRDSIHKGYFYENRSGTISLFSGMTNYIEHLGTAWDNAVQDVSPWRSWVLQVWDNVILPMLCISIQLRTTAEPLYEVVDRLVTNRTPAQNVWQMFRSRSDADQDLYGQPPTRLRQPMANLRLTVPSMERERSSRPRLEYSNQLRINGSLPFMSGAIQEHTMSLPTPIREESVATSGRGSSFSTQSNIDASAKSPSPISAQRMTEHSPECHDLNTHFPEKCHAIQVSEDGNKVFVLAKHGMKSLTRSRSSLATWKLMHEQSKLNTAPGWQSFYLAEPFLLLKERVASRKKAPTIHLQRLDNNREVYRSHWDCSVVPDLASIGQIAISTRGYIALRSTLTKHITMYNCRSELVFRWDLALVDYPDDSSKDGNIEAMAFDRTGDHFVAVGWNCWYLWTLTSLNGDRPSRYGRHSYTQADSGRSMCTLQVFPGAKHFLLHDHCKHNKCICVDTSQQAAFHELDLAKQPKPQTVTISTNCNWLAYIVDNNLPWSKCCLYYHRLYNMEPNSPRPPSLGQVTKVELKKIKTVKIDPDIGTDAVVRIVSFGLEMFAIVASISKFVEIIPLTAT